MKKYLFLFSIILLLSSGCLKPNKKNSVNLPTAGNNAKETDIFLDSGAMAALQKAVDDGHQPWRTDPLWVAWVEGSKYFEKDYKNLTNENFALLLRGDSPESKVIVIANNILIGKIYLIQYQATSTQGIWEIHRVEEFY